MNDDQGLSDEVFIGTRDVNPPTRKRRRQRTPSYSIYTWVWRHLPGPLLVRLLLAAMLITAAVVVLFNYVFPLAAPFIPTDGTVGSS